MISEDENGNMTIQGRVGYGEGERDTALKYVEKANGAYTISSDSGDTITLTVNLSLSAEGSTGDFNVLSLRQLSSATGKSKSFLVGNDGRNGPCVVACAVASKGLLYFDRVGKTSALHETFHLFGFDHQSWGIMKESEYTSLIYNYLTDLRSAYFGD